MRLADGIAAAWNGLLDVVYPPRCLVCGRDDAEPLCRVCIEAVVPLSAPYCDRCGIPITVDRLVCGPCEEGPEPSFAWSQAVGQYTGVLRSAIHRLKYDGRRSLTKPLGALLVTALDAPSPLMPPNGKFDCVVPVPMHRSKLRSRGFNQAETLARVLAAHKGYALDTLGLRRVRKARTQTAFHAAERQHNVHGAFDTKTPLYFEGRSILLIDDVLTTMATVNECARVLRNAGARRVAVLALARGQ